MFDCVGYVFGSGPVFCIDKKKKSKRKKRKKEKKRGWGRWRRGKEIKKNPVTFAVFNLLLWGQTQLTVLTSGHLKIRARTWLLSPLWCPPPTPTAWASFYAPCYHRGLLSTLPCCLVNLQLSCGADVCLI